MTRLKAIQELTGQKGRREIERITGLKLETLLKTPLEGQGMDWDRGWFMGRTCSLEFNLKRNFPSCLGNLTMWLGAVRGRMI